MRLALSRSALLAALGIAAAAPCAAQPAWKPDKPVEFVVLSAPGGGNDRAARLIQTIWRGARWLENVHVLNKPGGGGALAYTYVSQLREQGYDVVHGNWTAIMGPKGLGPAQVAYWEGLLERTFNHPAWKGMLEADALEADFRKSQPTRELVARDYETERRMLNELGMVK